MGKSTTNDNFQQLCKKWPEGIFGALVLDAHDQFLVVTSMGKPRMLHLSSPQVSSAHKWPILPLALKKISGWTWGTQQAQLNKKLGGSHDNQAQWFLVLGIILHWDMGPFPGCFAKAERYTFCQAILQVSVDSHNLAVWHRDVLKKKMM